jgi:serine/threonine protein kinase
MLRKRRKLNKNTVLFFVLDILLVREIKNIQEEEAEMLTNPNVYLKVTDFGLSVKLSKSEDPKHSTESGKKFLQSRCGSEEYAAPEIILGREYDGTKTDGWALGVIGYSLVMGFLPFKLPQRKEPGAEEDSQRTSLAHSNELLEDDSEQAYLKKRKQGLLKIIKSEYRWKLNHSTHHHHHQQQHHHPTQNQTAADDHQLVQGQIQLVDRLLVRDPLKRSNDLLYGFRDSAWLGRFNWLKDRLLSSS